MNLDFIKQEEGLRLKAYLCPAGVPTIGYGSTLYPDGSTVKLGDKVDLERAELMLRLDVNQRWNTIKKAITVPVNTNQILALVSLTYNIGVGRKTPPKGFLGSTLLKRINASANAEQITAAFLMWDKITVNGKHEVSEALVNRRKREAALYFKP